MFLPSAKNFQKHAVDNAINIFDTAISEPGKGQKGNAG
jgi:hypothetical protein